MLQTNFIKPRNAERAGIRERGKNLSQSTGKTCQVFHLSPMPNQELGTRIRKIPLSKIHIRNSNFIVQLKSSDSVYLIRYFFTISMRCVYTKILLKMRVKAASSIAKRSNKSFVQINCCTKTYIFYTQV